LKNFEFIRLSIFLLTFIIFFIIEKTNPSRQYKIKKSSRWFSSFLMSLINTILIKFISPFSLFGFSLWCSNKNFGLFNLYHLEGWFWVFTSIIIFDFLIYIQHFLFHKLKFLWKIHRVHHSDPDLDVSTAIRFHPIEIIISYTYKILIIFLFGFSITSVLLFEILISSLTIFNHSNIKLSKNLNIFLKRFFVTPEIHTIHHSTKASEINKNFGFNLVLWDQVFGTYLSKIRKNQSTGLQSFSSKSEQSLMKLLGQPFKK
jgi:sterol desaturase/sphingolipid hydroxylase (fatty acid hydroxylase superfamily)